MIELFRLVQLYDFAAARDEIQWIRMEVRLLGDANSNSSSALYRESALFHIQSVIDRNSNDLDAALENLQESCAILEHMDTTFADRIISCRFEEIMLLSEMGLEELAIEKGDLLFSQVYFDEDVWNFLVEQ